MGIMLKRKEKGKCLDETIKYTLFLDKINKQFSIMCTKTPQNVFFHSLAQTLTNLRRKTLNERKQKIAKKNEWLKLKRKAKTERGMRDEKLQTANSLYRLYIHYLQMYSCISYLTCLTYNIQSLYDTQTNCNIIALCHRHPLFVATLYQTSYQF